MAHRHKSVLVPVPMLVVNRQGIGTHFGVNGEVVHDSSLAISGSASICSCAHTTFDCKSASNVNAKLLLPCLTQRVRLLVVALPVARCLKELFVGWHGMGSRWAGHLSKSKYT
jgi:hypothetical protein